MNHLETFRRAKHGLFVHFVHGATSFSDGRKPQNIDETVDSFDVEGFADTVARMGVQYLIFTVWHWKAMPLYPSAVHEKWRASKAPKRDLIGEIVDAVTKRGILMILYTHPRDGHDFDPEDQAATGWSGESFPDEKSFHHDKWNQYILELYEELFDRYASKISGIYTDGMGPYVPYHNFGPGDDRFQIVNYLKIRAKLKDRNPSAFMIQNYFGNPFCNDISMPEGYPEYQQLLDAGRPIPTWPVCMKSFALQCFTHGWYVGTSVRGESCIKMPPDEMVQYAFLQASVSDQGGVAWATGPYCEGNTWGVDVVETLTYVGDAMHRFEDSLMRACPSRSYPTVSGDTLLSKQYRFCMTSEDGAREYLHLLKIPDNGEVLLPFPADGAQLYAPHPLTSGITVDAWEMTDDGMRLTLSGSADPLDTVIVFERKECTPYVPMQLLNNTDPRIAYIGDWRYADVSNAQFNECSISAIECDYHVTFSARSTAFLAFEGHYVEIIGATGPDMGTANVYIDRIFVGTVNEASQQQMRVLAFRSENLGGGWHTLEIVTNETKPFVLDAIRIIP